MSPFSKRPRLRMSLRLKKNRTWQMCCVPRLWRRCRLSRITLSWPAKTSPWCFRLGTTVEKDTYDYEKNKPWSAGKDGDCKWGAVNTTTCYIFDDSLWRVDKNKFDCTLGVACTVHRQDTIVFAEKGKTYKCDSKKWQLTTVEWKRYKWLDLKFMINNGTAEIKTYSDTLLVVDE